MPKVKFQLQITATLEKDGTYYGTSETLEQFVDRVMRTEPSMQVLIKEGSTEPRLVAHAQVKVVRVILEP